MRSSQIRDNQIRDYLVDNQIFTDRGVSRSELVTAFNFKRTTTYESLERLEIKGIVRRFVPVINKREAGRPEVLWQLVDEEF